MAFLYWSEELSANIVEVDMQHQKLVAVLNDLHSAMMECKGDEVLGKIINELAEYTVYHFATEEGLFDKFDYPGAAIHKAQHADFIERVSDFRDRFASGEAALSIVMLDFLAGWVREHIRISDRKFGPFLNNCGVY